MKSRMTTCVATVLILAACGGDGGGSGSDIDSPCDLATPAMVEQAFNGTASEGEEGQARNCSFEIEGGISDSVDVYYFGTDDGWDGTRSGFKDNRGGTTDIAGIGDEAFYPNDMGMTEVVVRAGGHIFEVASFTFFADPADTEVIGTAVGELAKSIADALG